LPPARLAVWVVMNPSTGPPQGTKSSPRLAPSRKPPPRSPDGRLVSRRKGRSTARASCGITRVAANRSRKAIDTLRRKSCGSPSWSRSQPTKSSERTKVTTRPAMIA